MNDERSDNKLADVLGRYDRWADHRAELSYR